MGRRAGQHGGAVLLDEVVLDLLARLALGDELADVVALLEGLGRLGDAERLVADDAHDVVDDRQVGGLGCDGRVRHGDGAGGCGHGCRGGEHRREAEREDGEAPPHDFSSRMRGSVCVEPLRGDGEALQRLDLPLAVDDECLRHAGGAERAHEAPGHVAQHGIGDVVALGELLGGGREVLVGHADERRVVLGQDRLLLGQDRRLGLARITPGGEHVEHDHLAPEVRQARLVARAQQGQRLTGVGRDGERAVGHLRVDRRRVVLIGDAEGEQRQQRDRRGGDQPGEDEPAHTA